MKNLKFYLYMLLLSGSSMLFTACEDEDDGPVPPPPVLSGVFIVNEGDLNGGNGSISFSSRDSVYFNPDIYNSANSEPLGDVVKSLSIYNRMGYICVNNSHKLIVVDMVDFRKIASVIISYPRYFTGYSNKGFVSDWVDNSVKVIDLQNNSVVRKIDCGKGPEQMQGYTQSMYVCNSGGASDIDSTITVFNVNTYQVTDTITVGINPNSIILDRSNKLWVICNGSIGPDATPGTADDIGGKLVQVDPANNTVIQSFDFGQFVHPLKLQTDAYNEIMYWLEGSSGSTGAVMQMHISNTTLPTSALVNREFYGFGIRTDNKDVYGGVASTSVNSYMLRYQSDGTFIDSVQVGVNPNGFVFY